MDATILKKIKAIMDLTRIHFGIVWPLLFSAGFMLGVHFYGNFSWSLLIRVALIGFFGFEAGMVWNDILDHKIDQVEPDTIMTGYWRPFKERPIPSGLLSLRTACVIAGGFLISTLILIATLPSPNRYYIYGIMLYAYLVETFYNLKKRNQRFPIAQLIGRTDLTIFLLAGYLSIGQIDTNLIWMFLLLYPWAQAHLGVNDFLDYSNDKAKKLQTITVLYKEKGNLIWNFGFTLLHGLTMVLFLRFIQLGVIAVIGHCISLFCMLLANQVLLTQKSSKKQIRALPLFHLSLFLIISSIILNIVVI